MYMRALAAAAAGLLVLVAPGVAAAQAPPPFDEAFYAFPGSVTNTVGPLGENLSGVGELVSVDFDCNPEGTESTIRFVYSGVAVGTYPGTFTETATVRIEHAPATVNAAGHYSIIGRIAGFDATFQAESGTYDIRGEKHLAASSTPAGEGTAACSRNPGGAFGTSDDAFVADTLSGPRFLEWEATITGPGGAYRDEGTAEVQANGTQRGTGARVGAFQEFFASGSTGPVPLNTPGRTTGGGQIDGTAATHLISFGFEAKSRSGETPLDFSFQGQCNVQDRARNTHVRCLTVTGYTQAGPHVTFRGEADVNGERTDYVIDVDDLGEPNQGKDTFKIVTGSGYEAAGNVTRGNVQVSDEDGPQA